MGGPAESLGTLQVTVAVTAGGAISPALRCAFLSRSDRASDVWVRSQSPAGQAGRLLTRGRWHQLPQWGRGGWRACGDAGV